LSNIENSKVLDTISAYLHWINYLVVRQMWVLWVSKESGISNKTQPLGF